MFRRSRSQSLSTADRNRKVGKNVNNFKRSGSVQDLKVLGGKKDMLNKKKTKLTRQESADIRTNDEGKNTNLTPFLIWQVLKWCSPASAGYLQSHPELTSALQKLFIHLCTPGQDDPKEIDHCFSAVDFFADKKYWEDNQRSKAGKNKMSVSHGFSRGSSLSIFSGGTGSISDIRGFGSEIGGGGEWIARRQKKLRCHFPPLDVGTGD